MTDSAASALRSKSGRIVIGDARTRSARRTRVVARRPWNLVWSRPSPQPERDRNRIDIDPRPPRRLVAVAMQFAMVRTTDGDRVFIADLSSERAGLGESKMMWVGRRAAAHDAGLARRESGVLLVAKANGLAHAITFDCHGSSSFARRWLSFGVERDFLRGRAGHPAGPSAVPSVRLDSRPAATRGVETPAISLSVEFQSARRVSEQQYRRKTS